MLPMTANRGFTGLDPEAGDEAAATDRPGRAATGPMPRGTLDKTGPEWAAAYRRMMAGMEEGASLGGLRIERKDLYDR